MFNELEFDPFRSLRYHCGHIFFSPNDLDILKQESPFLGMYLTQPPCRQAWFAFKGHRLPSRVTLLDFSGLLEIETGITIGDVLKAPSMIRGVASVHRTPKKRWSYTDWELPKNKKRATKLPEVSHNHDVTLNEVWESLYGEGEGSPEQHGIMRCEFLDTIIPTDKMWASVAPYAEKAVVPPADTSVYDPWA